MKHVYVNEDFSVGSIVPDEDPIFPGIPVEQRYNADFLKQCITVEDSVANAIKAGSKYDPESGTFYVPKPPNVDENPDQPIDPGAGEGQKTYAEKLAALETENKQLTAKLDASIKSGQMLEDCLVEMAEIVYA
nr:MAG TPA: hypothetical protein [Caudoviricetes sp.]